MFNKILLTPPLIKKQTISFKFYFTGRIAVGHNVQLIYNNLYFNDVQDYTETNPLILETYINDSILVGTNLYTRAADPVADLHLFYKNDIEFQKLRELQYQIIITGTAPICVLTF